MPRRFYQIEYYEEHVLQAISVMSKGHKRPDNNTTYDDINHAINTDY